MFSLLHVMKDINMTAGRSSIPGCGETFRQLPVRDKPCSKPDEPAIFDCLHDVLHCLACQKVFAEFIRKYLPSSQD